MNSVRRKTRLSECSVPTASTPGQTIPHPDNPQASARTIRSSARPGLPAPVERIRCAASNPPRYPARLSRSAARHRRRPVSPQAPGSTTQRSDPGAPQHKPAAAGEVLPNPIPGNGAAADTPGRHCPRGPADTAARPLRRPAAAQPHDESAEGTRQADLDGQISDSPSGPSRNGSRNTSATSQPAGSAPTKRRRLPTSGTAARHGHTSTIRLHVSNPTNRPVCRVIRMRFHALCARSRGCQSAEAQKLRILRSPFSGRRRRTCGSRWHPHARG